MDTDSARSRCTDHHEVNDHHQIIVTLVVVSAHKDALVIVDLPVAFDGVVERLRQSVIVTQLLPPRLLLASSSLGERPTIPEIDGATSYVDDAPPPEVYESLTPAERQFVDAWLARSGDKIRLGDGLSWDAPGFQPPDRPI